MIVAKFKGLDKAEILGKSDYGSRSSIEKVLTTVDVKNAIQDEEKTINQCTGPFVGLQIEKKKGHKFI